MTGILPIEDQLQTINFKLLEIFKVSDLYQPNLAKFMHKYSVNILLSSFDNFFSKTVQHIRS